jgi:amino acid transporter
MESASIAAGGGSNLETGIEDKGLKKNALGLISSVVIGVASTAPGYSLAATLGLIVASGVAFQAPAIMLVAFVPMFCIAYAYRYMNRADPDCGTSFAWSTRALGPQMGWLNGWAIIVTDILVMGSLAEIAGLYTFKLFDWTSAANSVAAVTAVGVVWIVVMTAIVTKGIELSARTQQFLLTVELLTLVAFAITAIVKVYVNSPAGSHHIDISWFSPFALPNFSALSAGLLAAIFIYWGWDSAVSVNEETEDKARTPGRAAVVSTVVLVGTYVLVAVAAEAFTGPTALANHSDDVLGFLGGKVFPSPLDKLVIIAVLTSASASTQTTILPTARTALSMARWGALPKVFGRVHESFQSPHVASILMGLVSAIWYIAFKIIRPDFILSDTIDALGFGIAFYYGITGVACVVFYRRELLRSARNFLFAGVLPLTGAVILGYVFVKSSIDLSDPKNTTTGASAFGLGTPILIALGSFLLGIALMSIGWAKGAPFFKRKLEVARPGLLEEEDGPPGAAPTPVGPAT